MGTGGGQLFNILILSSLPKTPWGGISRYPPHPYPISPAIQFDGGFKSSTHTWLSLLYPPCNLHTAVEMMVFPSYYLKAATIMTQFSTAEIQMENR